MTNKEALKDAFDKRGIRTSWVAKQLGISPASWCLKVNNKVSFTPKEISIIQDAVNLSNDEVKLIFLTSDNSECSISD